jgi:hypothetical protein
MDPLCASVGPSFPHDWNVNDWRPRILHSPDHETMRLHLQLPLLNHPPLSSLPLLLFFFFFLLVGLLSPPLTYSPSFLVPASFYVKTPDPHRMSNNDCHALVASPNPKGAAQLKIPQCNNGG